MQKLGEIQNEEFTDVQQIMNLNPIELLKDLEQDKIDQDFQLAIPKIQENILNFYTNKLFALNDSIRNGSMEDNQLLKSLETLETSLKQLPNNQTVLIKEQLPPLKMKINNRRIAEENNVILNLDQNKVGLVVSYLEKFGESISFEAIKKINKAASSKFDKITQLIKDQIFQAFNENLVNDLYLFHKREFSKIYDEQTKTKLDQLVAYIRQTFEQMRASIKSLFTTEDITKLSSKEENKDLVKTLFAFIQLCSVWNQEAHQCILPDGDHMILNLLKNASNFMREIDNKFNERIALFHRNQNQICKIIKQASKSNQFLIYLKNKYQNYQEVSGEVKTKVIQQILNQIEELSKMQNFQSHCNQINKIANNIIQNVKENDSFVLNERTRHNQKDRNSFYSQLQQDYEFLSSLSECSEQLQNQTDFKANCISLHCELIKEKIQMMSFKKDDISKIMNSEDYTVKLNELGLSYENLKSITQECSSFKNEASNILNQMKESIEEVIEDLNFKAISKNPQIITISRILILFQRAMIYAKFEDYQQMIAKSISNILGTINSSHLLMVNELINELKKHPDGNELVQTNTFFQGHEIALMNKKIQSKSFESIIGEMNDDSLDNDTLLAYCREFQKEYNDQISRNLCQNINLQPIISAIKSISTKYQGESINGLQLGDVPQLVARIFTLWTLMRSEAYFKLKDYVDEIDPEIKKKEQNCFLLQPHPVQVIAIFRLFYLSFKKPLVQQCFKKGKEIIRIHQPNAYTRGNILNNLVQVKTGEGKSVILAITATIFALWGCDVSCVCYSKYLSSRDYQEFEDIFSQLNLTSHIFYGTIQECCERHINQEGSIRELTKQRMLKQYQFQTMKKSVSRPQVLLIDEVDVFFGKEFFNQAYIPITEINDQQLQGVYNDQPISQFLDYLWANRERPQALSFVNLTKTDQFKSCEALFRTEYKPILIEISKSLLKDLKDFMNHDWVISNGMIGYKNQDSISTNIRFGYKTLFAYYYEASKNRVSQEKLQQCKSFNIDSAIFSYAEIPHSFCLTLGVTGTLDSLTKQEKSILKNNYQIEHFTYCPSVYGISKLYWDQNPQKVFIEKSLDDYYLRIIHNMSENLIGSNQGQRSCIIFFENQKILDSFKQCQYFKSYEPNCQVLNEQVDDSEKNQKVNIATYPSKITLATRAFARGTDFVCRNEKVLNNGGVHIIQTFLSEFKSEFIQLQGRTARQGERGSFVMIVLQEDLKKFDIDEKQIEENKTNLFTFLEAQALQKLQKIQKNDKNALKNLHIQHEQSLQIKKALLQQQSPSQEISDFLIKLNRGPFIQSEVKTLILMDATGSMSLLLNKTKNSVGTMFERAGKTLQKNGLDPNMFSIQFACYRNYSSGPDKILQYSPWETKPMNLRSFMSQIDSSGGQGNEAIEIGLWHAYQEAEKGKNSVPLSQVFLIGDMPPNTKQDVEQKRNNLVDWQSTIYAKPTYFEEELARIKKYNIPIFSFYVNSSAKTSFTFISDQTGGRCQFLDVNNEKKGQQQLTDLFVEQILRQVGEKSGASGFGEKLVNDYKKEYGFVV